MLDEFGALGRGLDVHGRDPVVLGPGNSTRLLCITSVNQGHINLVQHPRRTLAVGAYNNAVRVEKICYRHAFAKEFRVGDHIEILAATAVEDHGAAHPLIGVDRNSALFDNNFIAVR